MYLRHTTRRKDGKVHTYWRLVRSVRVGRKVRAADRSAARGARCRRGGPRPRRWPGDHHRRHRASRPVRAGTRPGRAHCGAPGSGALGTGPHLRRCLARVGRCGARCSWTRCWNACCPPAAKTCRGPRWPPCSCWPGCASRPASCTSPRIGIGAPRSRICSPCPRRWSMMIAAIARWIACCPHKTALEQHLVQRLGELFALDYDLLLYDVTSTYFEGAAARNPLAQRGHSRDHRPDCKQVCLALVVTREGMPLGYELFAGNKTDVTTVRGDRRDDGGPLRPWPQRIWVMDRGMTSADNLAWLRQTDAPLSGRHPQERAAQVGARRSPRPRTGTTVRDGVEAKRVPGPDGAETFVLIRSVERREKERAMHARFAARIEAGLTRLAQRLAHARRPLERGPIERQLGRLLALNPRAAGRYLIDVVADASRPLGPAAGLERPSGVGRLGPPQRRLLRVPLQHRRLEPGGPVAHLHPTHRGRSRVSHPEKRAGRSARSGISARTASRPTSSSAFSPTCSGRPWSSGSTGPAWATARAPSSTNSAASRAPMSCCPTTDGRDLRLRCVVRPDRAQAPLLDRLGLDLPRAPADPLRRSPTRRKCSADFCR